jgi:hypothetical protein
VRMRQTIGAVMVALLVLAAPLPAMCGQCQFPSGKLDCHQSQTVSPAFADSGSESAADKHCQHLANSQSGSAVRLVSTRLCQDRPCLELRNTATKVNRWVSQLPQSHRTLASTVRSGAQELVVENPLQVQIAEPPLIPLANQPFSITLRI